MSKGLIFWILAIVITIGGAYYQRVTGPTYPLTGKIFINQKEIKYKLERSHSTSSDYLIEINTGNRTIAGDLEWKRYRTSDDWSDIKMTYKNGNLSAELPKQPSAGKLQYKITLFSGEKSFSIPKNEPVTIRFKDDVPLFILIPHIIAMFGAMLLSTRTGLEIFNNEPKLKKYTAWTLAFLIAGGMILGPLVQYYAFGALWTGFPFGMDLTDNKTLIALIGWLIAAIALYRFKQPKGWILAASVLLFIVYLIPHSMFGSELNYNKLDKKLKKNESVILNFHQ